MKLYATLDTQGIVEIEVYTVDPANWFGNAHKAAFKAASSGFWDPSLRKFYPGPRIVLIEILDD